MVDYSNIPRDSRRVPLETRVQFKFDRFSGFLSDFSANISPGGMFIRTRAPQPPGTVLEFEFRLGDGFELIKGRGEVVWVRPEDEGPTRPGGMGLRFLELSLGSKELIYRIVDHHIQQGGTPFDVTQRPPDPVPIPVPTVAAPPPRPAPLPPPAPQAPSPAATTLSPLRFEPKEPAADATGWLPSLDDPGGFDPSPYVPARDDWMKSREPLPDEPFPELAAAVPLPLSELEPEPLSATSAPYAPTAMTAITAMTEPAAPPETPFFGATLAAEPARRPRRALPWILLAVLVVVAAGAFLFRDALLGLAGLGGDDEIAQAPSPASRQRAARLAPPPASDSTTPAATPAEATPSPTPDPTSATTPAPTPPGLETEVSPVRPAPTSATQPEKPAPVPAIPDTVDNGPAATAVEKITFEPAFGGTDILLWGNGALRSRSYTRSRIDGNPPRELIRITGIKRPFPSPRVVVGTPEVLQVRTGIHGSELHVVLDLAGPKVTVTRVEEGENRLRIHLQRQ